MKILPIKPGLLRLAAVCTAACVLVTPQPAAAQSLVDGYWNPLLHQDGWAYAGGPDQADFAGMPITPAALTVAQTWEPGQAMLPSLQCAPFNALYGPRSLSINRFWETRDPYTNQQATIETQMGFAALHRVIHMLPRPAPKPWAQHSWEGYSTGKWVGNVLWVHTEKLKQYSTRVGQPFSDKASMDERFFRYGDLLVDVMMISDPPYLSRPWIYSKLYYRVPNGNIDPYPCTAVEQVERPEGMVPMHMPGHVEVDGPVRNGIPLEAARGGEKTMYPEYQDYMKTLPPNPPLAEVLKELQRASDEAARLR
jgi:hypothetical protein